MLSKNLAAVVAALLLISSCGNKPSDRPADPVSSNVVTEIDPAVETYRAWVGNQCDSLVSAAKSFVEAVLRGDLDTARKLYAPSRMYYERIEPIAEAIGDLDPRIDAREGDVPTAQWTGYHVLEKALWSASALKTGAQLAAADIETAQTLLADIKQLRVRVESATITISGMVTGAVELLNEVSATKVTGEEERYSHTDLWDFGANVEGAREIYSILRDRAVAFDAALASRIDKAFATLLTELATHRLTDDYALYTKLAPAQVKQLSQAVDALAEPLSRLGALGGR